MKAPGGSAARRLVLETIGWVLVVAGIAALVLPGPGLLAIFAGLALLSQQYEWAERRLEPVKEKALEAAQDSVETWPRIVLSVGGAWSSSSWASSGSGARPPRRGGRSTTAGGSSAAGARASPRSLSG